MQTENEEEDEEELGKTKKKKKKEEEANKQPTMAADSDVSYYEVVFFLIKNYLCWMSVCFIHLLDRIRSVWDHWLHHRVRMGKVSEQN